MENGVDLGQLVPVRPRCLVLALLSYFITGVFAAGRDSRPSLTSLRHSCHERRWPFGSQPYWSV